MLHHFTVGSHGPLLCLGPVGSHSPPWHSRIPWRMATRCTTVPLDPTARFSSIAPLDLTVHCCTVAPLHHWIKRPIACTDLLPSIDDPIYFCVRGCFHALRIRCPCWKNHRGLSRWSITAPLHGWIPRRNVTPLECWIQGRIAAPLDPEARLFATATLHYCWI